MRLAWWIGGVAVALLYAWVFYYFFVSPTGFRWRALYGDANYPKGYEIHGIDISHYQGDMSQSDCHSMDTDLPAYDLFVLILAGHFQV